MGELIILEEWKKDREIEELKELKAKVEAIVSSLPPVYPEMYSNHLNDDYYSLSYSSYYNAESWSYDMGDNGEEG
tara:strand:+ start:923 stop:1147 length:225 start_codon:yes stop_codon:yes gene_type:complete